MRLTSVTERATEPATEPAPEAAPEAAKVAEPAAQPTATPTEAAPSAALPETTATPAPPEQDPATTKATGAKQSVSEVDNKTRQDAQAHDEAAPPVTAAAPVAAANDGSSDFSRQMPAAIANATSLQAGGKVEGATAASASDALRASEPSAPATPAQSSGAVKEIAVRIATPQSPAVDVHLVERGGQLQVSVRTADGGLQTSLRQDLPTLVSSLERAGYRAETFTGHEGTSQPLAVGTSAQTNSQDGRQESGSGSRGGNSGDSQNSGGGQQQDSQKQGRDPRSQKWIEELENLQ